MSLQIKNEFLQMWLEYVEDTETPRIMHVWTALSGVGGCLGRRVYLPFGIGPIFPNMFVLLVGPPGARKSTAALIMRKRVRHSTGVRFAPDDTAGQRKGLIVALANTPADDPDVETLKNSEVAFEVTEENLARLREVRLSTDARDKHCLFAVASEFSNFIGTNAREMVKFLNKMYDGEDYEYRISNEQETLKEALLSFIGCTTPTNIAEDLPPGSIGQGFTSRIILVFDNKRYKDVPEPPPLPSHLEKEIDKHFGSLYYDFEAEMARSPSARDTIKGLYNYDIGIQDSRFLYYAERRQLHLLKVSIILAATRFSKIIEREDVEEAHNLLIQTEKRMSDALGEFGLSPFAMAQQRLLEFIQQAKGAVTENVLWLVAQRDFGKKVDFNNALDGLVASDKITQVQTNEGRGFVYRDRGLPDEIVDILAEKRKRE